MQVFRRVSSIHPIRVVVAFAEIPHPRQRPGGVQHRTISALSPNLQAAIPQIHDFKIPVEDLFLYCCDCEQVLDRNIRIYPSLLCSDPNLRPHQAIDTNVTHATSAFVYHCNAIKLRSSIFSRHCSAKTSTKACNRLQSFILTPALRFRPIRAHLTPFHNFSVTFETVTKNTFEIPRRLICFTLLITCLVPTVNLCNPLCFLRFCVWRWSSRNQYTPSTTPVAQHASTKI